jgi:hypothetical protein
MAAVRQFTRPYSSAKDATACDVTKMGMSPHRAVELGCLCPFRERCREVQSRHLTLILCRALANSSSLNFEHPSTALMIQKLSVFQNGPCSKNRDL